MCEAHICDVIRARFAVRKVTASHSKGQAVILSESRLDEAALRQAIAETGYEVTAVSARPPRRKKGLFGFLKGEALTRKRKKLRLPMAGGLPVEPLHRADVLKYCRD